MDRLAATLGVADLLVHHGWVARDRLGPLYARAHMIVLPSRSEGWPKVLSEAMAYGAVPIASTVGSIPQYLREFGTGAVFDPADVEGFASAILEYARDPGRWKRHSEAAMKSCRRII